MIGKWYVFYDQQYFGPYQLDEIIALKNNQKLPATVELWQTTPGKKPQKVALFEPMLPAALTTQGNSPEFAVVQNASPSLFAHLPPPTSHLKNQILLSEMVEEKSDFLFHQKKYQKNKNLNDLLLASKKMPSSFVSNLYSGFKKLEPLLKFLNETLNFLKIKSFELVKIKNGLSEFISLFTSKFIILTLIMPLLWIGYLKYIKNFIPEHVLTSSAMTSLPHRPLLMRTKDYEQYKSWWKNNHQQSTSKANDDKKKVNKVESGLFIANSKDQNILFVAISYSTFKEKNFQIELIAAPAFNIEGKTLHYQWPLTSVEGFISLKLPKNVPFIPGIYQLQLTAFSTDKDESEATTQYKQDQVLVGPWEKNRLLKELKIKNDQRYLHTLNQQKEIEQKYQSLIFMAKELKSFSENLEKAQVKKRKIMTLNFKKKYTTEFGSFFSQMLLENEKQKNTLLKKDHSEHSDINLHLLHHLNKLNSISERMGLVADSLLNNAQMSHQSKKNQKNEFMDLSISSEKLTEIMNETETNLTLLNKKDLQ